MEVWRDVVGYEGLYEVSNRGNVRSLNWRGTGITKTIQQKKHNRGYWQVILSVDGVQKTLWKNSRYVFLTTGMSDWSISECCRGNRKSAYGYRWQYANYNSGQESPKS